MGAVCFRGGFRLSLVGNREIVARVDLRRGTIPFCPAESLCPVESLLLVITTSIFSADPGFIISRVIRLGIPRVWVNSLGVSRLVCM